MVLILPVQVLLARQVRAYPRKASPLRVAVVVAPALAMSRKGRGRVGSRQELLSRDLREWARALGAMTMTEMTVTMTPTPGTFNLEIILERGALAKMHK